MRNTEVSSEEILALMRKVEFETDREEGQKCIKSQH